MTTTYDTIIIGAGPGGLATAYGLVATQHILVIEGNLWGGTCPNFGCDPKKMLYGVVEAKRQTQRYGQSGLIGTPQIDWAALMRFKESYTAKVPSGTERGLTNAGIDHVYGQARLVDGHTVQVDAQQYTADHIVIATGARPTIPDIPGKEQFLTSTDFLALPQLPQRIGFVGAGYVAIELANIAAEAGAEVHVFQHNDRLLRGFPQSYTEKLQDLLAAKGIHFHMNTQVQELQTTANGAVTVRTDTATPLTVDAMFTAVGRRANLDNLGLDHVGIDVTGGGIVVDDHLRTTVPSVLAIGDAIAKGHLKLTPVSGLEGRYVATLLKGTTTAPINYPVIPHTVFAGPELAQVGVTLQQAQETPEGYLVRQQNVGQWYTYHRLQDDSAQVTTIQDRVTGQLVGAVVLAVNAEELVNDLTEVITNHKRPEEAFNWVPIYPSVASDLGYFYH